MEMIRIHQGIKTQKPLIFADYQISKFASPMEN